MWLSEPEAAAERALLSEVVFRILWTSLTLRQYQATAEYFGLGDRNGHERFYREIASLLHICTPRAHQLVKHSIWKLSGVKRLKVIHDST
jgi:hypothetical protein